MISFPHMKALPQKFVNNKLVISRMILIGIICISGFAISDANADNDPDMITVPPYIHTNPDKSTEGHIQPTGYPPDLTADIPWIWGTGTDVEKIKYAFDNARTNENSQLGTSLPMMTMPTPAEWDNMNDNEKVFWLIQRERIDRGVAPLHGPEPNVTDVAQAYAQYLLDHNAFSHSADGKSPMLRVSGNPNIGNCWEFVGENLAAFMTGGSSLPLTTERSVYNWMYKDATSAWGHRHIILWYPYNDNSGTTGMEGFLGIGKAEGGPWVYSGKSWNYAHIIVMDVFDPCQDWQYDEPEINVKGNNATISDGDASPSLSDHTDFGDAPVPGGAVVRTFMIENTGAEILTIGTICFSGIHAGDFSVSSNPSTPVAVGAFTTFNVTFNPSTVGIRTAEISIVNNDSDENPYNFAIQGNGTTKGDVNGDGKVDLADAILVLRLLSGADMSGVNLSLEADCNGDGKIGIEEAIYILERITNLI